VSSRQKAISQARLGDVCDSLGLQALIDFLAMHGNALRRDEAETYLIASHPEHSDRHFIADHY
jgi:hypothetical protein